MITGVGTDVVEVRRFRKLQERQRFLGEVFTENEIRRALKGIDQDSFLATIFAIKEALLKALECGLHAGAVWRDIEVTRNWQISLSGALEHLAKKKSISTIHISHSHSETKAIAFVVLETTRRGDTP